MAHVVRPLLQWPRWRHYCSCRAAVNHLLIQPLPLLSNTRITTNHLPVFVSFRNYHFSTRAVKLRDVPSPSPSSSAESESDSSSDGQLKKSRNEKKREARRAFRWGMELAKFSPIQIKRILKVASLEREVFQAITIVKRLGRDVREGKRRQFNLIGKMLREVEPDLMDNLIQTTKEGTKDKFVELFGADSWDVKGDDFEAEEIESDDEDEDSQYHKYILTRWYNGLINKDIDITNEVYSTSTVDFDRQELRRLVRRVQSVQEHQISLEEKEEAVEAKLLGAQKSLTRFLRRVAKQIPAELDQ